MPDDANTTPPAEEPRKRFRLYEYEQGRQGTRLNILPDFQLTPTDAGEIPRGVEQGMRNQSSEFARTIAGYGDLAAQGLREIAEGLGINANHIPGLQFLETQAEHGFQGAEAEAAMAASLEVDSAMALGAGMLARLPTDIASILAFKKGIGKLSPATNGRVDLGLAMGTDQYLRALPERGVVDAAEDFTEGFLVGQTLHAMAPHRPAVQAAASGTLFGGLTALEGGSPEEIAGAALGMAALPLLVNPRVARERAGMPQRGEARRGTEKPVEAEARTPEKPPVDATSDAKPAEPKPQEPGRIRDLWGPEAEEHPSSFAARRRYDLVDDLWGIGEAERQLTGAPGPAYRSARLLRSAPLVAKGILTDGVPKRVEGTDVVFEGAGIAERLAPVSNRPTEFFEYMDARQARELSKQGREKLIPEELIERTIRENETPEFKKAFDDLVEFNAGVIDFMVDMGVMDRAEVAKFGRKEYASSFAREMTDLDLSRGGTKGSSLESSSGVFKLRGSRRHLKNPIDRIVEGPARMIQLAMENKARQRVADLAQIEGSEAWIKQVSPTSKRVRIGLEHLEDNLRSDLRKNVKEAVGRETLPKDFLREGEALQGSIRTSMTEAIEQSGKELGDGSALEAALRVPGMLEMVNLYFGGQRPDAKNLMTVLRDGKPEYYEIQDPLLLKSLDNFRRPEPWFKPLNSLRRFVQGATTNHPGFWAANAVRDAPMSSIMTRTGFQHQTAAARALKSLITNDQNYQDFQANGGGGAGFLDSGAQLRRNVIRLAQRRGKDPRGYMVSGGDIARLWKGMGSMTETVPRLGEFIRAREQGKSREEAAFMAREITTDFGMRGAHGGIRFAAETIPFFNAMLVSNDRVYRGVTKDRGHRATTLAKMSMVPVMSGVLHAYNTRENPEEYGRLESHERASSWHWWIPEDAIPAEGRDLLPAANENGKIHIEVPKFWEVGVAGTHTEYALESMMNSSDRTDREIGIAAMQALLQNYHLSLPVGVQQVQEQLANRVWFTGREIENRSMQGVSPRLRFRAGGPETLRQFGLAQEGLPRSLQISPVRADAFIRGLTASWSQDFMRMSDALIFPGGPSAHLDQMAVASRFLNRPNKSNRYVTDFFNFAREVHELNNSVRLLDKQGEFAQADRIIEENPQADFKTAVGRVERTNTDFNAAMLEVRTDQSLSRDQKRDAIEKLRLEKNANMEDFMREAREELKRMSR